MIRFESFKCYFLQLNQFSVIVEPSSFMKICMLNTLKKYGIVDPEIINEHPSLKSLLYASLFLHGILLVRKLGFYIVLNNNYLYDSNPNYCVYFRNVKNMT